MRIEVMEKGVSQSCTSRDAALREAELTRELEAIKEEFSGAKQKLKHLKADLKKEKANAQRAEEEATKAREDARKATEVAEYAESKILVLQVSCSSCEQNLCESLA